MMKGSLFECEGNSETDGSRWDSNPPATGSLPPAGFEDHWWCANGALDQFEKVRERDPNFGRPVRSFVDRVDRAD
jgi:hypothetical protein